MVTIVKRKKARFRIYIYDLKTKKARCISIENSTNKTLDEIKEIIINCFEKA